MNSFIFLFILFFRASLGSAQFLSQATFKLFLVGDAGENDTTEATLKDLQIKLQNNPNSAVIFLGDNCYKRTLYGILKVEVKGFDGSKITRKRIMSQLNILRGYKGSAYFVPGNHDWWNCISIKKGKKHLLAEQLFIEDSLKNFTTLSNRQDTYQPKNGDAGPVSREFEAGKIKIIFIDTYRLILEELVNKKKNTALLDSFYTDLEDQLKKAAAINQKVIVAAHHPIYSKGKHSQPIKFWHKPIKRFANSNSNYAPNKKIASRIDSLLKKYKNSGMYYVNGHEHALEYFCKDSVRYIVSGAGSKTDKVKFKSQESSNEFLIWNEEGFFEIEFFSDHDKILLYHRKDLKSELQIDCLEGCDK